MIFWGALLALAWEQLAPLFRPTQFDRLFGLYADWVHDRCNAGTRSHGWLAWSAAAVLPALAIGLVEVWLGSLASLLGMAWSAAVLYRCLGFRLLFDEARMWSESSPEQRPDPHGLLAESGLPGSVGQVMDALFRLGLSQLFGVLFWFVLFGTFGAVAYALTHLLAGRWRGEDDFHAAVAQIMPLLNWLPARLLAFSFAVVGNFEAAIAGWRVRSTEYPSTSEDVVRAAGLGALGLDQEVPGPEYAGAVISLMNRTALLWLGVLGLFWLGGL